MEASGVQLTEPQPGISSVFLRDPSPRSLEVQQQSFLKHFNVFFGHSGGSILLWCVDVQLCPHRGFWAGFKSHSAVGLQFNVFKGDLHNQVGALACAAAESGLWK